MSVSNTVSSASGVGNVNVVQPIVSRTQTSENYLRRRLQTRNTSADNPGEGRDLDNADCHSGMGAWLVTGDEPKDDDCASTKSGQPDGGKPNESITEQRQIPRITVNESTFASCDEWGGQFTECEGDDTDTQSRRRTTKPSPVVEVRRVLQELSRAREASERSQDWADFLERELLAHINARISVEEQHKMALRKLSATRLVNKRVKQRCERLQVELRELHIGIEQCIGKNNNLEPDMKAIDFRQLDVDKNAHSRTVEEAGIGVKDIEEAEEAIRRLEEPHPTEEEAYIEELFANEVVAAGTDGHDVFNDIDEAKCFWEEQYTQKRTESTHSNTSGGVNFDANAQNGSGRVNRAEFRETHDDSEHSSDPECSVQSKKEMWEERLRMGVRSHPADANNAGDYCDATDVQLSSTELNNAQRSKSLWAEKDESSPSSSPRLSGRSTKSDASPGSIQLAKQMWEERTSLGPRSDHSPGRRLSVGEVSVGGDNNDNEASLQRPITREVLMTSERECENTSDNVLAEPLPSVSQTKRLFEQ